MPSTYVFILVAVGAVATLAYCRKRRHTVDEFLWRTESIRASVQRADNIVFGQFLNLDQRLRPNESGWTNMKIDIPENWQVKSVLVKGDRILLALRDGAQYSLCRDNIGELSFQILDGGPGKSDEILERIWNEYAREKAA